MQTPKFNSYTSTFTNTNNSKLDDIKNQVEEILKAINASKRF